MQQTIDHFNHDNTVSLVAFVLLINHNWTSITSMLPVFQNKASTSLMIYPKSATEINPEQTPVFTLDQPLYVIAKYIVRSKTEFNEDNYCAFLGRLHSEMLLLKLLGY